MLHTSSYCPGAKVTVIRLEAPGTIPPAGAFTTRLGCFAQAVRLFDLGVATKRASTDNLRSSQWQDDHFVIHYASVGYPKCHDPMGHCGVVGVQGHDSGIHHPAAFTHRSPNPSAKR